MKNSLLKNPSLIEKNISIVKITSTAWTNDRGIYYKRDIRFLKRKCTGHNTLKEDFSNFDSIYLISKITNLNEVPDGTYEVHMCNIYKDWENSYIEDWDYKLVPVEEED